MLALAHNADAQSKKNPGVTREPDEVDMKGTNPKVNSYAQDTAILNKANMGDARKQAVEDVHMKGTNPKVNSYAEDTAILNDVSRQRGKRNR